MRILDLLAPRSCVFCGTSMAANEGSLCCGCYSDLPWNDTAISPTPGKFVRSIAMLHYAYPVDVAIKALKFRRKLFYAPALAEVLCAARPLLPVDIDAVLAVPLHWRRKATRGFNQTTEIAKPLAKALSVPLIRSVRRTRATPFQSGLDASQRARNLRRAFISKEPQPYAHVLIIDDVITTGATVRALAKVLLASGTKRVSVLTVARAGV